MDEPKSSPRVFAVVAVFERLDHTLSCIAQLRLQTYPNVEIVIVDGGSRDGSLEALREEADITLIADVGEQWWTGATWYGIDHALRTGGADDFVLLLNDDTVIDRDFVSVLAEESISHDAAVGAMIVDADDETDVLNAGVTIDWPAYGFHLKKALGPSEFNEGVDTLEGRGVIVPLRMIRDAGNVDPEHLPHYAGDFELFCRIRRHGHRLGITGRTRVGSHRQETGLIPTTDTTPAGQIWAEVTSRRSMTNLRDHIAFVRSAAPPELRAPLQRALVVSAVRQFAIRTPTAQRLRIPQLIRLSRRAQVFALRPYPFAAKDVSARKLDRAQAAGLLESCPVEGWYDFRPHIGPRVARREGSGALWWSGWNPLTKTSRWRAFRAASRRSVDLG